MQYTASINEISKLKTACLVIGVFKNGQLTANTKLLDGLLNKQISEIVNNGDLNAELGSYLLLPQAKNQAISRVLVIGLGESQKFAARQYRLAITTAANFLKNTKLTEATFLINENTVIDRELDWKLSEATISIANTLYNFEQYRSVKRPPVTLKKINFLLVDKQELKSAKLIIDQARAIAEGMNFSKDLINTPPNICNPIFMAKQAQSLGKDYEKLKITVLDEKELAKIGMRTLLAVGQGSHTPPRLITVEYHGGKAKQKPITLIGKGITFDTGGINLKPAAGMVDMKSDMGGAASVLGVLKAACELQLPLNLVGILACAENMPDGKASRPSDVITSLAGKTVEITNTDAEGRLVLCDALAFCKKFNPEVVIDIATLTGAAIIALGTQRSVLLSNHQPLADALFTAGEKSYDYTWQLPLGEEYQDLLYSSVADMVNANVNTTEAGSITAACFLSRFAEDYKWAHLDIAGVAFNRLGKEKVATGRPIPLLMQFLLNYNQ